MSTPSFDPTARLAATPWLALAGLAPLVVSTLQASLSGSPLEPALRRTLRAHPHLSQPQRLALAEASFNASLWRRRLAFYLQHPAPPPLHLLFALLARLAHLPPPDAAALAGLPAPLPLCPDEPPSLALRYSLPDWLADLFSRELGPLAEPFCAHLNVPGPITLRVNSLRLSRSALAERLAAEGMATRPGALSPLALHVSSPQRPNLYGSPSWQQGLFETQDEGSQLLGLLLEPQPGETVLDACAGAGGKTLLLGAAMRDQGSLLAWDPDSERLLRLRSRAARAGLSCVRVLPAPPQGLLADRVLVDAPCSHLGALRRGPDQRFLIAPDSLARFPPLQRDILERAASCTRPGGRLVYATCTVHHAENQGLVQDFLREHPEFSLAPLPPWVLPSCHKDGFFFCAPHLHGTDAFFAAVLQRTE